MTETYIELARRAENAAINAGAAEAERLGQRAADLALKLGVPEGPLFTDMALERLMDLCTSDSWSGRGNDNSRAYRDGFVAKVRVWQTRVGS